MAQQRPEWTWSPTEWAVLRDQLTTTSQPSLSNSTQLSSYVLIALCSLSVLLHSCSIWLRFKKSRLTFGSKTLGYHQPNLSFILPVLFLLNATLNIASISSLLSDAHRLKFEGHTLAIQQINFSILLSAGVLIVWALACGLPPMHIGVCGPPRNRARRTEGTWKTMRPSRFNLIGYSSLLIMFLIPMPCAILSKKSTDDINNLDSNLLVLVNEILENIDQPVESSIDQALRIINKLDQTSSFLFLHIRMLSAIHIFFTLFILSSAVLVSVSIVRKCHRNSKNFNQIHQFGNKQNDPIDNPIDHLITEPKPAFFNDSTRNIIDPSERKPEIIEEYGCEDLSNKPIDHNPNIGFPTSSFTSESVDSLSITTIHRDQSKKIKKYNKKIKHILVFLSISCLSFIVLNFCIVANLFKYPDEISIGDLSILKLEWSTWLWNGSMSPLIGFINCFILMKKNTSQK